MNLNSIQKRVHEFFETIFIEEADRKVAMDLLCDAVTSAFEKPNVDQFGLGWREQVVFPSDNSTSCFGDS